MYRYFLEYNEVVFEHTKKFGFAPTAASVLDQLISRHNPDGLTRSIDALYPKLLPSSSFYSDREAVLKRVRDHLISTGVISSKVQLCFFGSTANNFGSDGADVDMCLSYPPGDDVVSAEAKAAVITRIGEVFLLPSTTSGSVIFTDVKAIPTARIPVVNFKDVISGLDCDLTFHNPLALSNTGMLRAYSELDIRVRKLAYVIKYWAKARQINSPAYGTPSSYAYILCLLHFLQSRAVPVLPILQRVPMNWNGKFRVESRDYDCFGVSFNTREGTLAKCIS